MPAILMAIGILSITCFNSCKREYINYSTTSDVNIYSYLEAQADQFSLFKKIIDKAGYASFLNTYGNYTLFASNNDGVNAYLKATGKASVDNIDEATAKNIVSISLVPDTIATQLFTDGKMRTPSTAGQYLITGAANVGGVSSITVNKQANLVKGNLRFGNGLIHIIDNVLLPAPLTLAQMIEQNPNYSIFSEALKATGFYDTLNVAAAANTNINRKFLTLVAQTNAVFNAAGIADFNALKTRYSTTGNPKSPTDSLYLFVAYRVFPELSYLSDIVATSSHSTLAPLEVTTSMLQGDKILLNNDIFNGVLEPGVQLDRALSDNSASNGVLHSAASNYRIKVRKPTPVYFDLGDQPEVRRIPGMYRGGGSKRVNFNLGELADVTWIGRGGAGNFFAYLNTPTVPGSGDYYWGNDYVYFSDRFQPNSNGMAQIEFKTPLLVRGRYKVWVGYKRIGTGNPVVVSFDGLALANLLYLNEATADNQSDALLESRNLKRYTESPAVSNSNGFTSKMVGVINVTTTDRHFIRFNSNGTLSQPVGFDMVEFRPIDMASQILPRFGRNGSLIY
ncbi:fasciclin domain-containing protein [Mucilaginibacter terrae]|uniref:fasciclin domain-containing protein n=1 Tax=Mucilaginibacter terrae TaxID=1955052 RepID=UPI0036250D2B